MFQTKFLHGHKKGINAHRIECVTLWSYSLLCREHWFVEYAMFNELETNSRTCPVGQNFSYHIRNQCIFVEEILLHNIPWKFSYNNMQQSWKNAPHTNTERDTNNCIFRVQYELHVAQKVVKLRLHALSSKCVAFLSLAWIIGFGFRYTVWLNACQRAKNAKTATKAKN